MLSCIYYNCTPLPQAFLVWYTWVERVKKNTRQKKIVSPAQTACKCVVSCCFPRFCSQLKANIEHRVGGARHVPAFLTRNVTLELASEGLMNDAVA